MTKIDTKVSENSRTLNQNDQGCSKRVDRVVTLWGLLYKNQQFRFSYDAIKTKSYFVKLKQTNGFKEMLHHSLTLKVTNRISTAFYLIDFSDMTFYKHFDVMVFIASWLSYHIPTSHYVTLRRGFNLASGNEI